MKRTLWSSGLSVSADGVGGGGPRWQRRAATSGQPDRVDRRSTLNGGIRDGGDVAESTGLLDLGSWPEGMRVIVRRERPHPGAQLSLFEERDGWRYQAFVTNTAAGRCSSKHGTARMPGSRTGSFRHAKDTGPGRFPSRQFAINQTWPTLTAIAADLVAWTRLLGCIDDAATLAAYEPKALRYPFLHVPARLTHGARRRRLRKPETWPWAACDRRAQVLLA